LTAGNTWSSDIAARHRTTTPRSLCLGHGGGASKRKKEFRFGNALNQVPYTGLRVVSAWRGDRSGSLRKGGGTGNSPWAAVPDNYGSSSFPRADNGDCVNLIDTARTDLRYAKAVILLCCAAPGRLGRLYVSVLFPAMAGAGAQGGLGSEISAEAPTYSGPAQLSRSGAGHRRLPEAVTPARRKFSQGSGKGPLAAPAGE